MHARFLQQTEICVREAAGTGVEEKINSIKIKQQNS